MAMSYGHVYVAQVAFGAKDAQTVKAFLEAEAYPGPSLDHRLQPLHRPRLRHGARRSSSRSWRSTPALAALPLRPAPAGQGRAAAARSTPAPPKGRVTDYMRNEARFRMVERSDPARFRRLAEMAEQDARRRHALYTQLAGISMPAAEPGRVS